MGLIEQSIKEIKQLMIEFIKDEIPEEKFSTLMRGYSHIEALIAQRIKIEFMDKDKDVAKNLIKAGLIGEDKIIVNDLYNKGETK
jgi:hypothetical protein